MIISDQIPCYISIYGLTIITDNRCMCRVIVYAAVVPPVSFQTRIIEQHIVRLTEPVLVTHSLMILCDMFPACANRQHNSPVTCLLHVIPDSVAHSL